MIKSVNLSGKPKISLGALLIASSAITSPAIAQSGSPQSSEQVPATTTADRTATGSNEIIVTARRGEERLIDVPIAIQAFGSEELEKLNIQSLDDLSKFTPGLELVPASQPGGTTVSLRGLTVDRGRSAVAVRIDGIDVTAEAVSNSGLGYFPNQRLLDLERIEVVKGAQVALYGRSAFGGAINFVTKRPSLSEFAGSVSAGANSEREYEVSAKVSGPVIADKLGLGLTAAYWDDGGSYRNQLNGGRIGRSDGYGVSGSLLFNPVPGFTNFTRVEYSEDNANIRPGVIVTANTTKTFAPDVAAVLTGGTARLFAGEVPKVTEENIFIGLDPFTDENYRGIRNKNFTFSNLLEFDFGDVGFRSSTAYLNLKSNNYQSTTYRPAPYVNAAGQPDLNGTIMPAGGFLAQQIYMLTDNDIISQELQFFSNDSSSRFRWVIGGLYWYENVDQIQDQPTLSPSVPIPTAQVKQFLRDNTFVNERTYNRKTEHFSGFAWAEFDITETLALALEGRYSKEDIDYRTTGTVNVSIATAGPTPTSPPVIRQVSAAPNPQLPGFSKDSYFTPKATLTFKPNPDLTIYASAAKSVKPAGYATGGQNSFDDFNRFDRETLWSYEVGTKASLFDNRLQFDGALFYQDYSDQQISTTVLDTTTNLPRGTIDNAGKSRRYGVDLAVVVRPTPQLTFSGDYTYLDTKFIDYEVFTTSRTTAVNGPCVRIETLGTRRGCIISYDGQEAGQVPKHQFSVSANYTNELGGGFDYFIEPNVRYKGKRFLDEGNNSTAPDYWRADLRAGVRSDNLTVTLYVENVFDDDTPTNIVRYFDYNEGGGTPVPLVFLPDPRTGGVNVRYSF